MIAIFIGFALLLLILGFLAKTSYELGVKAGFGMAAGLANPKKLREMKDELKAVLQAAGKLEREEE